MSFRHFFQTQNSKAKQWIIIALFGLFMLYNVSPAFGQTLTHEMSAEEKAKMPEYLNSRAQLLAVTPPPPAPVRGYAEYEPMEGVLIAYPLGIPVSVVAEMSENVMVTTIVAGTTQENQARSSYTSGGVNMSNCNFLYAPHDSYWTRDYGPWFATDGNGVISVIDTIYNRPRANDDAIPSAMASFLGVDFYQMDIIHTGGNYMTDGLGISASTDLVWDENPSKTHDQINQIMLNYHGINTYHVTSDPLGDYIKHIDCWGKYLDVDKILITRVPTSDSRYSNYEAIATYFANQTTAYGNNYQVYRVYSSNGEPYTNSLILNNKVLVPIMGTSNDSAAIASYQAAMPGYEILGFTGSWQSTDALHCRVIGIANRNLLYIKHLPLLGQKPQQSQYAISADIIPYSGGAVVTDSVKIYYRINNGTYSNITMTHTTGNTYVGNIPGQAQGTEIDYYIYASDTAGQISKHPFIGASDPHEFTVAASPQIPVANFSANITTVTVGGNVIFTDLSTNSPTSWSWTFSGGTPATSTVQNPTVTYNTVGTYNVSLIATNSAGSDTETKTGYITVVANQYCASTGNDWSDEWIARVQVGTMDNSSGAAGYTNFTSKTANLTRSASVSVSLTPGYGGSQYTEYWRIWVDYNRDSDFVDTGEQVLSKYGKGLRTGTFTVPSSALTGTTRMRVSMKYGAYPTSCETFTYGEVEDYTANII
ncbi:MAG: agmatine deiminase family protein [Acidobacteria bacterium]|jgi:PKD repeat protein/agmatine/peptidylarginine deiminase|nr:agmatine deiminase family protein [Acidobacteriota bacterium]